MPLAAGQNHYTRFEFSRVIEDRVITILQPDLSKTGGGNIRSSRAPDTSN